MADAAPNHDWSSPQPVNYPLYSFEYSERVLPFLVALGLMHQHSFDFPRTNSLHDLFVAINNPGSTGTAFVKSLTDGDLTLRMKAVYPDRKNPIRATVEPFPNQAGKAPYRIVVEADNEEEATESTRSVARAVQKPNLARLTLPGVRKGDLFKITFEGGERRSGVMVLCDGAQIVHQVRPDAMRYYSHSTQRFPGTRVFVKTNVDTLRITRAPAASGFTVRDATTGEILGQPSMLDDRTTAYQVGKGRMVEIVFGAGRDCLFTIEGAEPYISARLQDWFSPQ
jgi:hypothetical protein